MSKSYQKEEYVNNYITEILDLADEESEVIDCHTEGSTKFVTIQKIIKVMICPVCGYRLHSKGKKIRKPKHTVLQDGYVLDLTVIGRKWVCSNPDCNYTHLDQFKFIEPNKKTTKIMPIMILRDMKDIHLSCRQVAKRFNVSDTYVHDVFTQYVSLPRKPLTEMISIDEVYLNVDYDQKYAVVIMDFASGDILDIVESRRKEYMQDYWLSIPKDERDGVKHLISDMYNSYINYVGTYFVNSDSIVDSFHVLKWLLTLINHYISGVKKKYQERDRKVLEERNYKNNRDFETQKTSREVYILNHARWVLLMSGENITYKGRHYNKFLNQYLDTYDWQNMFLALDSKFKRIRDLKDLYEDFNGGYINDPIGAQARMDELIEIYSTCEISIFRQFSSLLTRYYDSIINSFNYTHSAEDNKYQDTLRRLSNGPMESFNNLPSSYRSQSHGIANFEFTRNRILWAYRDDAGILGTPKTLKEVHEENKTNKKRGSYNKKK